MNLNNIPQNKTSGFPTGVSEHVYDTEAECKAFVDGVQLAQDIDVEAGTPFQRMKRPPVGSRGVAATTPVEQWVVRVKVGEWDDEDDDTDEHEIEGIEPPNEN